MLKFKLKEFNVESIAKPLPKLKYLLKFDPEKQEDLSGVYDVPYVNERGTLNITSEWQRESLVSENRSMSQTLHLFVQKQTYHGYIWKGYRNIV